MEIVIFTCKVIASNLTVAKLYKKLLNQSFLRVFSVRSSFNLTVLGMPEGPSGFGERDVS